MRSFLPSFVWPWLAGLLFLFGMTFGAGAQEDPPPEDGEAPAEEEEDPPPEPLEKLVFIESHVDGVDGVDGLDGSYDMKLSSDGAFLYVASMNDDAISIFARDKETGKLTYRSRVKNGEGGVEGLNGARSLDISPDGRNLYVVSMFDDALVSFSRDEITGALVYQGRIKDGEFGVDGLDGARSISISPDGMNLYVAGWDDDALALFSRNPTDGTVGFLGRLKHGEDGIYALDAPHFLTVAPDGKNVYVVLWDEDAISVYNRDLDTGLLTFNSKIENDAHDAAGNPVSGLQGPRAALASPDGKQLYAVAWNDDSLTAFNRDETGALEFVSTHRTGIGAVEGLDGAHSLAMSADGKFIYVAAFFDDAITVFSRDTETGELTYDQSIFNSEDGVVGLNGTLTIMASPDGEHVYSSSISEKSLVVFRREIVIDPPVFTVEPISKSIPANSSVSFNALAEGIEVSYQWMANGVNVAGANDPTFVIDPVEFGLGGTIYTVEASNPGGSVLSAEAVLTVLPEVTLDMPETLTALTQSSSTALIEWLDENENETGFEVQRKVAGGAYETIAQIFANSSDFTDAGLDPGTEYIYRIRATRPGEVSEWSNEAVIESFDEAPNGPSALNVVFESYNRIELQWSDRSAVEDGFHIERQDIASGGGYVTVGTVEKSVTTYLDRGVSPHSQYSYRVRAYNESGPSNYSNIVLGQTIEIPVDAISPVSRIVAASESIGNFVGVVSDSDWEAIPDVNWLIVQSPASGRGFGDEGVSYRVLGNRAIEERVGAIDIGGLIHTVTQEAASEYLVVSPSDSSVSTDGGRVSLTISANIPWTVLSNAAWITIAGGETGENNGSVELDVAANPETTERIAQVWVNEVVHTVTQGAFTFYTVASPTAQAIAGPGGSFEFELRSNAPWTLSESASWLEITTATSGEGDATVGFVATENSTNQARSVLIRANEATHTVTQFSNNVADESPTSPGGGSSDDTRTDGILITWTDNSDFELGFIIERTIRDLDTWTEIARVPANTTSYLDTSVEPGVAYTYRVSAYNDEGVSNSVLIDSDGLALRSKLVNLSTRAFVGTGDEILIAGFGISGTDPMRLLVRSVGPKLEDFNVANTLSDPSMSVRSFPDGLEVAKNDDWSDLLSELELVELETSTGAFSISSSSKDAVVVGEYSPGVYTTLLSDSNGGTGVALLELYEVRGEAKNDSRLINLSSRGFVGTGDSVMIGGFTILGPVEMKLLIRGLGPDLAKRVLSGTLADPYLKLHSGGEVLLENDNWEDDEPGVVLDAFALARVAPFDEGSKDSALVVSLGEGIYTVIMSGVSGETGIALFEIFVLE